MPRRKLHRRINKPPLINGFKPYGGPKQNDVVVLNIEEFEAIRLSDYENLTHEQSSSKMNISRPTFTRIIESARKKIATSFCNGLEIRINGGNYKYDKNWYRCRKCHYILNQEFIDSKVDDCPICGHKKMNLLNNYEKWSENMQGKGMNQKPGGERSGPGGYCVCAKCGEKVPHQRGVPCADKKCPACGGSMLREGSYHHDLLKKKKEK